MLRHWQASVARAQWAQLLNGVEHGDWQVIRRFNERVVAVRAQDMTDLLSLCCPFSPEVLFEDDGVAIWLPELEIYGRGASLEAAATDLLEAAREYAEEWDATLKDAPNHRAREWHVRRIQLAADDAALCTTLLGADAPSLCPA